jgi:hypothetical protein
MSRIIVGLVSACLGVGAVLIAPATSCAESQTDDEGDTRVVPPAAGPAAGVGAFQPFTTSARGDTQRALGFFQGGYDSARRGSVFQAAAEVQVWGRLSVRGGGSSTPFGRSTTAWTSRPLLATRRRDST